MLRLSVGLRNNTPLRFGAGVFCATTVPAGDRELEKEVFIMSTTSRNPRFAIAHMIIDALLIAVYVVMSTYLTIPLGALKITLEALPVVICAVILTPVDAILVGFLGEFLNQMLSPYGLTPTTMLWIAPIVARAAVIGLFCLALRKKHGPRFLSVGKNAVWFSVVCVVAAIVHSCLNTFAYYVDSKMFGYYTYYAVFGVFWIRIAGSVVSAIIMALATMPLVNALGKAGVVR